MKSPKDKHKMNYNKITKRTEHKTKRKIQTAKKLNGLPNAGNSEPKVTWETDDKLTLNEHERMTQIYTIRNLHMKREKKHADCDKIH